MVTSAYNASTWEVWAGESGVRGNPKVHSKLEASLGLMKLYLKKKKKIIYMQSGRYL